MEQIHDIDAGFAPGVKFQGDSFIGLLFIGGKIGEN